MSRMKRYVLVIFLLLVLLNLTGCWGIKEIEDQTVLVGIGMDVANPSNEEKQLAENGNSYPKKNRVTLTFQIIPFEMRQSSGKSDKSSNELYSNIQETGDSMFQMLRKMATRRSKPMMGHHVKVIVISEELAKRIEIDKLLKFVLRDNDIRPSCLVFISNSKASEVLVSNNSGEVPSLELAGLAENGSKANNVLPPKSLTKLDGIINSGQSFILQNLSSSSDEVAVAGASVIKGKNRKWIGSLSIREVLALSWIRGSVKGGVIKTYDKQGNVLTYEIISAKSKVKAKTSGKDISFQVSIRSKGRLIENWDTKEPADKEEFIKEAEGYFKQELMNMMTDTLHTMQDVHQVDVGGFRNHLRIQHPKVWRKVEQDWDSVFSRSDVKFDVDLIIEDTGSSVK
ncbi:Ger(x)C family spore germination protein [Paenibacillus lutimineralis]|uniref:Ger(X)C family spore germination protein n=2 Tax=Paenibacillus lutimineralis TaxID=2707005 RepID=A0A3S9UXI5_9BACL|nr:Ger(x)C family spore germination protein [Paenibacillus lutimineralis]